MARGKERGKRKEETNGKENKCLNVVKEGSSMYTWIVKLRHSADSRLRQRILATVQFLPK